MDMRVFGTNKTGPVVAAAKKAPTTHAMNLPASILVGREKLFHKSTNMHPDQVPAKAPASSASSDGSAGLWLQTSVLMAEPELGLLANSAGLLTGLNCSVTTVRNQSDLWALPRGEAFLIAVLNDTFGLRGLRSVAEYVRRTWPSARILILRHGKVELEDHLYDEATDDPLGPEALLAVMAKVLKDPWNRKLKILTGPSGTAEPSETPQIANRSLSPPPPESDPSKADPHDLDDEEDKAHDNDGLEDTRQPSLSSRYDYDSRGSKR